MKKEFYRQARPTWAVIAAAAAVILLATGQGVVAGTRTIIFGWEDGTSGALGTFANTPDTTSVTASNVTSGSITDFGPSGDPFLEPVVNPVSPFEGSRMMEAQLLINDETNSGVDGSATVAWVTGLNPGDTLEFSFYAFDPPNLPADRSPSTFPNSIYTNSSALGSFDGFSVPLQPFANFSGGNGWEEFFLDADGIDGAEIVTTIVFDPAGDLAPSQGSGSNSGTADAIQLDAAYFYQSLTAAPPNGNGDGTEELYVDQARISVTSDSATAMIILPDGSMTLVNEPAGVAGDYNENDIVDAADYTVWRDHLGQTFQLPNEDPSDMNPGVVDQDDYTFWKSQFGMTLGSGSLGVGDGAVPEPASLVLVAIGLIGAGSLCRAARD